MILEVGLKTEYNVHMFSTEKDIFFLFLQKGKEMKEVTVDWSTARIREDERKAELGMGGKEDVVAWVGMRPVNDSKDRKYHNYENLREPPTCHLRCTPFTSSSPFWTAVNTGLREMFAVF